MPFNTRSSRLTAFPPPSVGSSGAPLRIAAHLAVWAGALQCVGCDPLVEKPVNDPQPQPAALGEQVGACTGIEIARVALTREPGPPQTTATGPFLSTGKLCVAISAGDGGKNTAPASASVTLSGLGELVGPKDFNNQSWTRNFLVETGSYGWSDLTLEIASKPGSHLEAVVYEEGLVAEDLPAGSTPAVIYPEQGGRLDLAQASLRWGAGTVDAPRVIGCVEAVDGPEIVLECGPSMQFAAPITVSLPVSAPMMAETLATIDTEGRAPTVVWDGEPRPTITNVSMGTVHATIEHFSAGTLELLNYVTEVTHGEIAVWTDALQQVFGYQRLEFPINMIEGHVEPGQYHKFIVPKVPGTSLDIDLETVEGDTDLYTNHTNLAGTSRDSNQYKSEEEGTIRDAVSVPVTKAGLYYIAVQGFYDEPDSSAYRLSIRPHTRKDLVDMTKWVIILDAGHGLDEKLLAPYGAPDDDCKDDPDDTGYDDFRAEIERKLNMGILTATLAGLERDTVPDLDPSAYEVVTYDGDILSWAAGDQNVSAEELRWRETQGEHGCTAYRGFLMRKWVRLTGRAASRTVAVQIHNDSYFPIKDDIGSEASNLGADLGDPEWLARIRDAMESSMNQIWLGQIPSNDSRQAFIRGAGGYTNCYVDGMVLGFQPESTCPDPEVQDRSTKYGAPLRSASLLEAFHYNDVGLLVVSSNVPAGETDGLYPDAFIARTGESLADAIKRYVLARTSGVY